MGTNIYQKNFDPWKLYCWNNKIGSIQLLFVYSYSVSQDISESFYSKTFTVLVLSVINLQFVISAPPLLNVLYIRAHIEDDLGGESWPFPNMLSVSKNSTNCICCISTKLVLKIVVIDGFDVDTKKQEHFQFQYKSFFRTPLFMTI